MFINTNPRFPPFLLIHFRYKFGVTFARRCFFDAEVIFIRISDSINPNELPLQQPYDMEALVRALRCFMSSQWPLA